MKLAYNIIDKACKVVLLANDRELRETFVRDDPKVLRRAAERIEQAYKRWDRRKQ